MIIRRKKTYNQDECQKCKKCGAVMNGVRACQNPARDTCEPCGGNTTKHDENNPIKPK